MAEPARLIARLVAAHGQSTYYYRFGYVADSMKDEWTTGAPHASDIPWAFDTVDVKYGVRLSARDKLVARTWNGYFSNFAKRGDPNGPGLPRWRPITKANPIMMLMTTAGNALGGPDPWEARLDLVEDTAAAAPR
jgi:para-nitrobenzyl esterase